jgi:UDP-N-acetylmuramate dehydrogenase
VAGPASAALDKGQREQSGAELTPALAGAGPVRLADYTTLGLGGPAPVLYTATSEAEVAEALRAVEGLAAPGSPRPRALVLGGGSNLVVADTGVDVPVVRVAVPGVDVGRDPDRPDDVVVTIGAGEDWDTVVAALVDDGWTGPESLSGIPGSAGATPVQNVGAYGTEISDLLLDVRLYDRATGALRTVTAAELRLGYRSSALRGTDAAVVTAVRLRLSRAARPVRYAELARTLDLAVGGTAPAGDVRQAVLALRRGKGMVLDPDDPDTRSAGSFFTNPILSDAAFGATLAAIERRLGADVTVPRYPAEGGVKLSAAWLIERAGFGKGYPGGARPGAHVTVSGKHTLALTNRGGGSTAELLALAREIRDGVREAFAVTLRPEPVLVGVSLD